jgi:7-dehydrocholesterol reductase
MEVETTSIERSERFDMAIPIPRLRNHISDNQALQSLSSLTKRRASISKPWKNIRLSQLNDVVCLGLVIGTPSTCVFFWMSLNYFNGSIFAAVTEMHNIGFWTFWKTYFPKFDAEASLVYLLWVVFQALLYTFLPSEKSTGQLTAGGYLLEYRTNGLAAWIITVSAFVLGSLFGIISPSAIARHWEGMVLFLQMYGYILSVIVYIKGHWFPSYIEDCKFRGKVLHHLLQLPLICQHWTDHEFLGSAIYDFHMGIELNPRFGQSKNWDWKLFHNGRPGIILWTLM